MKKYKMIDENGTTLKRLVALRSFGNVSKNDRGGLIEKEANLLHDGNAWVFGNAWVYGDAWVSGDARVFGNARVSEFSFTNTKQAEWWEKERKRIKKKLEVLR